MEDGACGRGGGGWLHGEAAMNGSAVLLACSKAVANDCTLAKRLCGSFSKAVITICSIYGEMAGIFSRKGGGGVRACLTATSVKDPRKRKKKGVSTFAKLKKREVERRP